MQSVYVSHAFQTAVPTESSERATVKPAHPDPRITTLSRSSRPSLSCWIVIVRLCVLLRSNCCALVRAVDARTSRAAKGSRDSLDEISIVNKRVSSL
jgi:hypothetical protein